MTDVRTPEGYYPTTIPGNLGPHRPDRLVIVHDPDAGPIAVRWRLGTPGAMWKCTACGPMNAADCAHTFSAGIRLAADLLGLNPAIHPTERNDAS